MHTRKMRHGNHEKGPDMATRRRSAHCARAPAACQAPPHPADVWAVALSCRPESQSPGVSQGSQKFIGLLFRASLFVSLRCLLLKPQS